MQKTLKYVARSLIAWPAAVIVIIALLLLVFFIQEETRSAGLDPDDDDPPPDLPPRPLDEFDERLKEPRREPVKAMARAAYK